MTILNIEQVRKEFEAWFLAYYIKHGFITSKEEAWAIYLARAQQEHEWREEQNIIAWQGHSGTLAYDQKSLLPSTRHLAKPLYSTPPSPAVPDGWKLVPIAPTPEMIAAAHQAGWWNAIWDAMLAAAPLQHTTEGQP